jgi:hypothetical protein
MYNVNIKILNNILDFELIAIANNLGAIGWVSYYDDNGYKIVAIAFNNSEDLFVFLRELSEGIEGYSVEIVRVDFENDN